MRRPLLIIRKILEAHQHGRRRDMTGQRQLYQNAVDVRVGIQVRDKGQQVRLRGRIRKTVGVGPHAGALGRFTLVPDIDLAGRIVSDDDDGQAGLEAMGRFQPGRGGGDALDQSGREGLSVDQGRAGGVGRHGFRLRMSGIVCSPRFTDGMDRRL